MPHFNAMSSSCCGAALFDLIDAGGGSTDYRRSPFSLRIDPMSSYVEKALVQGEQVLYLGRLSLWSLFPQIFFGILLTPLIVGLFILVPAWIKYRSTELAVTNKRVIAKFGFVSRHTIELNVAKIESVQVEQGVLGRMFDFGSIIVAGGGNPFAPVPGIANPLGFRRAFLEAQEQSLGRRAP
jgi:uncharacterized membrane protein YdbT with pleckstrin-like domain